MPLMCPLHHRPSPGHDQIGPSKRTRVRRKPDCRHYDRDTIYRIVDEALFGHAGVVADGLPYVIPTVIARRGDELLLHGSARSRLMRLVAAGCEVCVAVTHLDGLIVSRSLFDSSLNYRSVVVFGKARPMTAPGDKLGALRTIVEHVLPGRWEEAGPTIGTGASCYSGCVGAVGRGVCQGCVRARPKTTRRIWAWACGPASFPCG